MSTQPVKVRDLCQLLEQANPETEVLLASDAEGNRFSPLANTTIERYHLALPWCAELNRHSPTVGLVLWPAR